MKILFAALMWAFAIIAAAVFFAALLGFQIPDTNRAEFFEGLCIGYVLLSFTLCGMHDNGKINLL